MQNYRKALALKNPAEVADSVVLQPGGIFNVGIAARQEGLTGGGWQFEGVIVKAPGERRRLYELTHVEKVRNLGPDSRIPL